MVVGISWEYDVNTMGMEEEWKDDGKIIPYYLTWFKHISALNP
jgi:hypothetical protein